MARTPSPDAAAAAEPLSAFWVLREHPVSGYKYLRLLGKELDYGIRNLEHVQKAGYRLAKPTGSLVIDHLVLPPDFPTLQIALPEKGFAPDYFTQAGYEFCSQKLREFLPQPEDVIQFVPVHLVAGGEEARAKAYTHMRVLPRQPAIDLDRTECRISYSPNSKTGAPVREIFFSGSFVLLAGLQPATDVFRIDEYSIKALVTDAIAERVVRAGRKGIVFAHPSNGGGFGNIAKRYRGLKGVIPREHLPRA
jgi:hypothetical protein